MHMYKESLKLIFFIKFCDQMLQCTGQRQNKTTKVNRERFGPSSVHTVMQSLVYIKRSGEYGTPVCTLGIHSITQLEGKNKNNSTRAVQVFNRFLCVHFTRDWTCPANFWSQRRCQLNVTFFPTALFVALNPA